MQPQNSASGYLLYCIYNPNGAGPVEGLTGIQEQTVEAVTANGLCAAVTALTGAMPPDQIEELKRYGQVVAACHQTHTTIPMRYGSVFRDKLHITNHLEEQGGTYKALLHQLSGNEEMGIRLLLPETQAPLSPDRGSTGKPSDKPHAAQPSPFSGKAYLARQKERYGLADAFVQGAEKALFQWRELFKGLYVDCRWERPAKAASQKVPILSAYFLVHRQHIADFKKTFVRISQQRPEKALLSGPWPPYNFVQQKKNEGDAHEPITCCPR